MKKWTCLLAAVLLGCSLTACGKTDGTKVKAQSYPSDGRLGTSHANPNLPTSPTYHTYSGDVNMINEALKGIKGIQDSTVVLRGPDALVNLDLPDDISIEDAMKIKRDAQESVSRMMPRYNVKVTVNKRNMLKQTRH